MQSGLPRRTGCLEPSAILELCILELWSAPPIHTLHQCCAVNHCCNRAASARLRQLDTLRICLEEDGCNVAGTTSTSVLTRVLMRTCSFHLASVHLYGLTNITDAALAPLASCHALRSVGLCYCSKLTVGINRSLPSSISDLKIAGCYQMYEHIGELAKFPLDIHVCPLGLREVEDQAFHGFRFIDPSLRAGIRRGRSCNVLAHVDASERPAECGRVPDIHGRLCTSEVWHASSFDWLECTDQLHLVDPIGPFGWTRTRCAECPQANTRIDPL